MQLFSVLGLFCFFFLMSQNQLKENNKNVDKMLDRLQLNLVYPFLDSCFLLQSCSGRQDRARKDSIWPMLEVKKVK